MISFKQYLLEAADDGKLKHLEHLDDLHLNDGKAGFDHAKSVIHAAVKHVEAGKSNSDLTEKVDGSPSLVLGTHPETGKFFVASKSAFNKNPKINYTHEDIEKNHGHAPGLVTKLKAALDHGHKVLPKTGVFQGDLIHTPEDHVHSHDGVSFKPNTITYKATGKEADKAKNSKVGVSFHTQYHGDKLEDMRAAPIKDHSVFGSHKDVHLVTPEYRGSGKLSPVFSKKIEAHLSKAEASNKVTDYSKVAPHVPNIKTYINSTVRTGTKPTFAGLTKHILGKHDKAIDSVKTEKAKTEKRAAKEATSQDLAKNREHLAAALETHKHLAAAKNTLVDHLNHSHKGLETSIGGKKSAPEGYVFHHNGQLTKLVDRSKFSAANFNRD